ncbi:MAG: hypothetical protein IJP02_04435 [Oscillospiraceae bacterium]|nr:hypothetical protein [Oscillospiraceae bacterium]
MKKQHRTPQLTTEQGTEQWELTLQDRVVVRCTFCLPQITAEGRGPERIARHYRRLEQHWRNYIQKELYLYACLDCADRMAAGRAFRPWQARLKGEVRYCRGGLLSLRLEWSECRGYRPAVGAVWGDCWLVEEGALCKLGSFAPHRRLKKRYFCKTTGLKEILEYYLAEDGIHIVDKCGRECAVQIG